MGFLKSELISPNRNNFLSFPPVFLILKYKINIESLISPVRTFKYPKQLFSIHCSASNKSGRRMNDSDRALRSSCKNISLLQIILLLFNSFACHPQSSQQPTRVRRRSEEANLGTTSRGEDSV